jgi:uncharacterized protein YbbK (DUF523 family)
MKIVSACLAGIKCKYDCSARPCKKVIELVEKGEAIAVCPEQLGGLPTPRLPAEQKAGRVIENDGRDITAQCEAGAKEGLHIAQLANCKEAILKSKSPSCGSGKVYDGTFSGSLVAGDGVFAKTLKKNNIKVFTEKDI